MKRKFLLMSMAVMAGLPGWGFGKGMPKQSVADVLGDYEAWGGEYTPHYGKEGRAHPLMDHLDATASNLATAARSLSGGPSVTGGYAQPSGAGSGGWKFEFTTPPVQGSLIPEPSRENDRRIGLAVRVSF
jgi:hypothetical protein